jgi:hypothetical protein
MTNRRHFITASALFAVSADKIDGFALDYVSSRG